MSTGTFTDGEGKVDITLKPGFNHTNLPNGKGKAVGDRGFLCQPNPYKHAPNWGINKGRKYMITGQPIPLVNR